MAGSVNVIEKTVAKGSGKVGRSKSSGRWLEEHFSDPWVQRAQREGWRSRAAYKFLEIDKKDQLLRKGMTVIDLGSAPGGWSQYLSQRLGDDPSSCVIALDILPMEQLPGINFIEGDFREAKVLEQLLTALNNRPVDLVISDMAPNMSGTRVVDQAAAMYLVELTLELSRQVLKPGGDMLVKVFQGEGSDDMRREAQQCFKKLISRKPEASRPRSREVYLLARGYNG